MEPSIKHGRAEIVGKNHFQKPALSLIPPSSGTGISPESGKLGAPMLGSAVNLRGKVALKPGRSLLDWMKLGRSGKDLAGTNGKVLQVTPAELALHNKEDDAWIALNGKVYNVTPYMEFHPGGIPEMMRAAGIDGTKLFNEVHQWVNYDSMLAKCLIGKYLPSVSSTPVHAGRKNSADSSKLLSVIENRQSPRYKWSQTETTVTISIHAENEAIQKENIIVDKTSKSFHLRLLVDEYIYHIEQDFTEAVGEFEVVTERSIGKADVVLQKETPGKTWLALGKGGSQNNRWNKYSDEDVSYRRCVVNSISSVTHNTKLYCIEYPHGTHMVVPVGKHVVVSMQAAGDPISREYTVVPPSLMPEKVDKRVLLGRVFYLMIKIYAVGLLTPSISNLKPGDTVDVSVTYAGNFKLSRLNGITHLIMYAAGTGFTPMASLLHHCFCHLHTLSLSQIQLVFFNKQEKDILWKQELDQLSANHDRFTVCNVLSDPDPHWSGLTGHVSKELMKSLSPKPENVSSILFCVCGPVQFTQSTIGFARELDYTDEMIFPFTS